MMGLCPLRISQSSVHATLRTIPKVWGPREMGHENSLNRQQLSHALFNFAKIWPVGALWVHEAGLVIKAEKDCRDGNLKWQCSSNCHLF